MEMIYIQFVNDLGGETYFITGCTRMLARWEREQMSVVGLEAVLKERVRTLRTSRILDQIIFPTLRKHLIAI